MFRTLLTCSALMLATVAQGGAPEWTLVADAQTSAASYVDRLSVTETSGAKSVWVLRNYAGAISLGDDPATRLPMYSHRSVKVRYMVDCSARRVSLDRWEMFSGSFANGEIVWADNHHGLAAFSAPAIAEERAAVDTACSTKTAAR